MATTAKRPGALTDMQRLNEKTHLSKSFKTASVSVSRLPNDDIKDVTPVSAWKKHTTFHIYTDRDCGHKAITPIPSPSQERRFGPTVREQKARRIAQKEARKLRSTTEAFRLPFRPSDTGSPLVLPDSIPEDTYYSHTPYLSFHIPPSILYTGVDRHAPSVPVALIHTACFWREYKIQLGPSLALPGVVDPRGVVSWRHNGGSKRDLREDEKSHDGRKLKGYRVRGWRLWGETGKEYVHSVKHKREEGLVSDDPDIEHEVDKDGVGVKVHAEEVVWLRWSSPFSRDTRRYTFWFKGVEFQWRGTGTVSEERKCGWMLRFCHLKLVARVPVDPEEDRGVSQEICLGKYTCSIAAEKSGSLEVFDHAVLAFVQQSMPGLLATGRADGEKTKMLEDDEAKTKRLKKGIFYQVIIATALCVAKAEKEKRHTIIDLLLCAGENAGNGGG